MTAASPADKPTLRFARFATWVSDSRPGGTLIAVAAGVVAATVAILAIRLTMLLADSLAALREGFLVLILPVVAGLIISVVRWTLPATTTGVDPFWPGHRLGPSLPSLLRCWD